MAQLRLRKIRRTVLGSLLVAAIVLPGFISSVPISAGPRKSKMLARSAESEPETDSEDTEAGDTKPAKEAPKIQLQYIQASWKKVLKDVAKATDTELVADKLPPKTFSRMDRKMHTQKEAFRIINNELEKYGLRAQIIGKHLVLTEIRRMRKDFPRAEIAERSRRQDADAAEPTQPGEADDEGNSAPVRRRQTSAGRSPVISAHAADSASRGGIRQVGGDEDDVEKSAHRVQQTPVRLKSRRASDLARIIQNAFESQSEEIDDGPKGLKGLRVFRESPAGEDGTPGAERRLRFTLGIDSGRNQLVVEAPAVEMAGVLRLIRLLDVTPRTEDATVRVVPGIKEAGKVAANLQPELHQLLVAAQQKNVPDAPDADDNNEKKNPALQPQPPAGGAPAAGVAAGLKGEVTVESVGDLLVIRGNQKDVESVMSVIREIERLSAGATPKVELVLLKNVPSDSIAALLTTVYDKLAIAKGKNPTNNQNQNQSVSVLPIIRPNALVIIAPTADIESIKSLAKEFDQPGQPESEFTVFRLKNAVASRIVLSVQALYPPAQAQAAPGQATIASLPARVRIVADMRTNSVVVQAVPRDMKEVASVIRKLDVDEADSVSQMRIFPLRSAVADELANTLQNAMQSVLSPPRAAGAAGGAGGGGGGAQGAPELREIKSSILEFLDNDSPSGGKVRSGILSDIRFTSDARTNCLVVTAPPESMALIERLVERLDRSAQAVAEIKVFPMSNGDATAMVTLLNGLFNQQSQTRGAGAAGQSGQIAGGLQIAGADDAGSTLIPLRFSADVRTNSVIAIGGTEALQVVHAVLLRLDESGMRERKNVVYRLKNSPATDVAAAISQFLQTTRQAETQDPGLISPFEQIEREVIVVAEPVTNNLLISATERYFKEILAIVTKLDEQPKQVLIQAMLVEVTLDNTDELGLELGLQDSLLFDRSLVSQAGLTTLSTTTTPVSGITTTSQQIVSQTAVPGFLFNTTDQLGNNTSPLLNTGRIGTQGLSNLAVGRVNTELGYGGLVLSAGSESVNFLLRALASRRRVEVLSRPQIRTVDNQLGTMLVGQEVPRVNGVNPNTITGNSTPNVEYRKVGIQLQVIPRISPDGLVVMVITANKDALNPVGAPIFTNANGSVITSAIIDTTAATSTVAVQSNQTIVLGGMISKTDDAVERKVPLLGDIPLVGQLFRYDLKKMRRTELLIFLTPRIIENDADAEMIKEVESQRIHFMQDEAEAIHGPLFAVPGADCYVPGSNPGEVLDFIPPSVVNPQSPGMPSGPVVPSQPAPQRVTPQRSVPAVPLKFQEQRSPKGLAPTGDESASNDIERLESRSARSRTPARSRYDRNVVPAGYNEAEEAPRSTSGGGRASMRKIVRPRTEDPDEG